MSAKNLFLEFLNIAFLVILVTFVLFFFIAGNKFGAFVAIMKSLVPIAIFIIILLVMLKIKSMALKQKAGEEYKEEKIVLRLSHLDLLKLDAIIFLLPVIILLIALFIEGEVTFTDIVQATIALLLMHIGKKILFKKGDIY